MLTLAVCTGCYSFSGSIGTGIKSVAVPVFTNQSVEYGIAEDITSGVIDGFVKDNTMKVVSRNKADAVLEGTIKSYERVAYTFDESDNVQEYRVNISTSIRLVKSDGSTIWEEPLLAGYGIYRAADESEEDGKTRAIEKIAEDIVNRTVKDW